LRHARNLLRERIEPARPDPALHLDGGRVHHIDIAGAAGEGERDPVLEDVLTDDLDIGRDPGLGLEGAGELLQALRIVHREQEHAQAPFLSDCPARPERRRAPQRSRSQVATRQFRHDFLLFRCFSMPRQPPRPGMT
jgi:hypothetical protein